MIMKGLTFATEEYYLWFILFLIYIVCLKAVQVAEVKHKEGFFVQETGIARVKGIL